MMKLRPMPRDADISAVLSDDRTGIRAVRHGCQTHGSIRKSYSPAMHERSNTQEAPPKHHPVCLPIGIRAAMTATTAAGTK